MIPLGTSGGPDRGLRRFLPALAVLCFVSFPSCASADAGTPLMWVSGIHLIIGNFFIGIFEGLLLVFLFRAKAVAALPLMIAANYFSAWFGYLYLAGRFSKTISLDLHNAWAWLWVMVGVTYLLSIVLEWPFVALALWKQNRWLKRSLLASLVVQTASYIPLFGIYWESSGTTLYTMAKIVEPPQLAPLDPVQVYYIKPSDGRIYRRPLDGTPEELISPLPVTNRFDQLAWRPESATTNAWNLTLLGGIHDLQDPESETIVSANIAKKDPLFSGSPDPRWERGMYSDAPQLGGTNRVWSAVSGSWAIEGLRVTNSVTHRSSHIAYEVPYCAWQASRAVILPSGKILFQLGQDQICLYDPETSRIALLWEGRSPLPILQETR